MREKKKSFCHIFLVLLGVCVAISTARATDPIVRMTTSLGPVDIQLLPQSAPRTVANFLRYAGRASDGYNGTFIHRSNPGFVIQGGGFITNTFADLGTSIFATHIHTDPPVMNEFSVSNVRGTVGMAKLSNDPNSATSEWFFNLVDNSANLDHSNGGFTVFGRVIGNGMSVVDAIAALPLLHNQTGGVPLHDFGGGTAVPPNLVNITITQLPQPKNDFSNDRKSDLIWQNSATGERAVWLMNGLVRSGIVSLLTTPVAWSIAGGGDLNGDFEPDVLWQNSTTGQCLVWLMHGAVRTGSASLGTVPIQWNLAAAGDLNGDHKLDLLWQNTATGERSVWLMNGTARASIASLGTVATPWSIAAAADFNSDGKTDILWQNTTTGQHSIWLMNGTTRTGSVTLSTVATVWKIAGADDFNGDSKPDILWQNNATGQRSVWLMNGTARTGIANLGTVSTQWDIRNH